MFLCESSSTPSSTRSPARYRSAGPYLVTPQEPAGEPEFESSLSVDAQAKAAIMRKVCAHGLGLFRVIPDEQFHSERIGHGRAA